MKSVNAGHNPPYLFRDGQPEPVKLKKGGLFRGGMDFEYAYENITMQKDDVLVYYTDGVTEAWNKKQQDYGKERLIKVISQHLNESSKEILTAIDRDVEKYVNKAPQSDDITCLYLKKN